MRAIRSLIGAVCCGLGLSFAAGCQESNEPETKIEGIPPGGAGGVPKSQQQAYEQQQKVQAPGQNPYGQSYPGGTAPPGR